MTIILSNSVREYLRVVSEIFYEQYSFEFSENEIKYIDS